MAFSTVTVSHSFGASATGTLTFRLSEPITNGTETQVPEEIVAALDAGNLSVTLVANDDLATTPAGTNYTVTQNITGAPIMDYAISVPSANPTVDLGTLMPSTPGIG